MLTWNPVMRCFSLDEWLVTSQRGALARSYRPALSGQPGVPAPAKVFKERGCRHDEALALPDLELKRSLQDYVEVADTTEIISLHGGFVITKPISSRA